MTNTIQLRTYIDHQGIKVGHIASVLGMSSSTLRQKLNNEREFKVSEAERLAALLELTRDERDACFFGPVH